MNRFRYAARRDTSELEEGVLRAESEEAVARVLRGRGLYLVSTEAVSDAGRREAGLGGAFRRSRWGPGRQALLARQLADLLGGGLTVDAAVGILEEQASDEVTGGILRSLREAVQQGRPLSAALSDHPDQFPRGFPEAVRAGEASGALDHVLHRMADILEREDRVRTQIREAVTYPAMVACVGLATLIVLFVFVVPRITSLYQDFGQILPLPTRVLLAVSQGARTGLPALAIGLLLLAAGWARWRRTEANQVRWGRRLLRLPVVGTALLLREHVRFSRLFGALVDGGVPVLDSLALTSMAAGNAHYGEELRHVRRSVHEGRGLAGALAARSVFTGPMVAMVRVGETSGDLASALARAGDLFERGLDGRLKKLTTLLEPMLILLLGLVVAFVVFAMLLPILQIDLMVG